MGLPAQVWDYYAFTREILAGKLTCSEKMDHAEKSRQCGRKLAKDLRDLYREETVEELANLIGVSVDYIQSNSGNAYTEFARYYHPGRVTIYIDNANNTDMLIEQEGLREIIGAVKTADVLLAHELFHFMEFSQPDIYTMRKHILLWKLGPFKNESTIACLEEIGAMEFCKQILGLDYSPYVFDVLMLNACSPQRAKLVYDAIIASANQVMKGGTLS